MNNKHLNFTDEHNSFHISVTIYNFLKMYVWNQGMIPIRFIKDHNYLTRFYLYLKWILTHNFFTFLLAFQTAKRTSFFLIPQGYTTCIWAPNNCMKISLLWSLNWAWTDWNLLHQNLSYDFLLLNNQKC